MTHRIPPRENRSYRAALGLLLFGALLGSCNRQGLDPNDPVPDMMTVFTGPYTDFPSDAVVDTGGPMPVPSNAGTLFGPAGSGAASGGPCLIDPEVGSLFPKNWLRLRFRFSAPAGQNLFEIRMHAANQINDLVVYTTSTQWTMPADMWSNLTAHTQDQAIKVTVRGAQYSGGGLQGLPSMGTSGDITIAPVATRLPIARTGVAAIGRYAPKADQLSQHFLHALRVGRFDLQAEAGWIAVGAADMEMLHLEAAFVLNNGVEDLLHDVGVNQVAFRFHHLLEGHCNGIRTHEDASFLGYLALRHASCARLFRSQTCSIVYWSSMTSRVRCRRSRACSKTSSTC